MSWKLFDKEIELFIFPAPVRWNFLCFAVGIFAFFILFEAFPKDKNYLEIGKPKIFDSLGLKFKQFKDSSPVPLPTLATMKLKASNGEPLISYKPKDLWIYEEVVQQWKNPAGTLVLAQMTLPLPDGLKIVFEEKDKSAKYCLKEDFESWKKSAVPEKDDKAVIAWLNYLTDSEFKAPLILSKGTSKDSSVKKFSAKKENATIWAFEVAQHGNKDSAPIFFIFNLASSSEQPKNEAAINQFIAGITFAAPAKNNVAQESKEPHDTSKEKIGEKGLSPELAASRDAVIKSIANLKGWWSLVTDNFIIVSNLEDKNIGRDVTSPLEPCRSIFAEYYPALEPVKAFSVCRVFQSKEGYLAYVGPELDWSKGMWVSSRKELVIYPQPPQATPKEKKDFISSVICHEGFLQYLYHVSGETGIATWFNEGNAAYFEGIEFKSRGRYEITACPKYLGNAVKLASRNGLPVAEVFLMDVKAFHADDARENNYATAWAITYYLRNGCQVMKKRRDYENVLSRYYDAMRKIKDPDKAIQFAFEGIALKDFANDVTVFFKEGAATIKKSEGCDPIKYLSSEPKKKGDWWEDTPQDETEETKDNDKE